MVHLNWTHTADLDLKAIYDYIARNSTYYASREVSQIFKHAQTLTLQPDSGKIVLENKSYTLREIVFKNYRIVYEIISPQRIDILFIHHGARDLQNRLNK